MKRLCTFGGCNIAVEHDGSKTSPRCTKHKTVQTQAGRSKYTHHIDDRGRNIYNTAKWRKIRRVHLLRNPLCVRCLKYNQSTLANVVDHILEIADGSDPYDMSNLQSLCPRHHNVKTGEEKAKRNKPAVTKMSDFP
jgi:5-methylcytosine-specific restriction protein A